MWHNPPILQRALRAVGDRSLNPIIACLGCAAVLLLPAGALCINVGCRRLFGRRRIDERQPVRLVVDTAATAVTLPSGEAGRLGLDHRRGGRIVIATANGTVPDFRIKLDLVRVGSILLDAIDAVVVEGDGLPPSLLGMGFL